jgi:UDP-2,3-diacylglucosamine pyrophosphatase LpxH
MNQLKYISKLFNNSQELSFDDSSRIVFMSDVHRGNASWSDDFSKNENITYAALNYYYQENYAYIEVGDGDELWENTSFYDIFRSHSDIFQLLSKFHDENRLYMLYGNHDIVKRNMSFVEKNFYRVYNERRKKQIPLFENIKMHEGLVLKYRTTGDKIFVIHGHQADYLNGMLWRLSRFLVRYLWRPLEFLGVNNPTSTANNTEKKEAVAKRLTEWILKERHMLIAGHTHKPMFPEVGEVPYFNDGSCVHPRCIIGLEIINGCILLMKWSIKTKEDGVLYIARDILAGPRKLTEYFKALKDNTI